MSTAILYIKTHIKQYKIESFWRMSNHLALKLALLHGVYSTKEKKVVMLSDPFLDGFYENVFGAKRKLYHVRKVRG